MLELGGPSLKYLSIYSERPTLPFLQSATKKLAEGIAAIHSAGVCYGGKYFPPELYYKHSTYHDLDLTDSNLLFRIKDIQDWTEDEVYQYLGQPKTEPLLLRDGTPAPSFAPTHVVDALDYSHLNMEQLSSNTLIIDFGEAFFEDDVPEWLGTPMSFHGPELFFGYSPSYAADLWALGCLTFEIYTFRLLIPTGFGTSLEALGIAIETIGAPPEAWQKSYYEGDGFMDDPPSKNHTFFDKEIQRTRTLESQILKLMPELS